MKKTKNRKTKNGKAPKKDKIAEGCKPFDLQSVGLQHRVILDKEVLTCSIFAPFLTQLIIAVKTGSTKHLTSTGASKNLK